MAEKRKGHLNINKNKNKNKNDTDKHEDLHGFEEAGEHVTNTEEIATIQREDRI